MDVIRFDKKCKGGQLEYRLVLQSQTILDSDVPKGTMGVNYTVRVFRKNGSIIGILAEKVEFCDAGAFPIGEWVATYSSPITPDFTSAQTLKEVTAETPLEHKLISALKSLGYERIVDQS